MTTRRIKISIITEQAVLCCIPVVVLEGSSRLCDYLPRMWVRRFRTHFDVYHESRRFVEAVGAGDDSDGRRLRLVSAGKMIILIVVAVVVVVAAAAAAVVVVGMMMMMMIGDRSDGRRLRQVYPWRGLAGRDGASS